MVVALAACGTPLDLSAIEQLAVNQPADYDFGAVQVGSTSPVHVITFSMLGFEYDVVNSVSYNCPGFIINPDPTPADVFRECEPCTCATPQCVPQLAIQCCPITSQNYSVSTQFKPIIGGQVSCAVTANLMTGGSRTVTLTGTGTLPPVQIDVKPTSVNFGDVRRNTDSSLVSVTVKNAGSGTMTVSSTSLSAPYAVMSGPSGSYQVGGGQSVVYSLACHPTTTGAQNGSFAIHSDDPNYPTKTVSLACNGIDSALDVSPSPAALATTRVGEPVSSTIVVKNSGTASLSLEGVTVAGADIAMTNSVALGAVAPGGVRNVNVTFGASAQGAASGTLTVTYDGGQKRTSQITANALATSMSITPDGDIKFGPICVGQTKSQSFSVLGAEDGAFKVTGVTSSAPFSVAAPNLPFTVQGAGANKLTFDVTAAPTAEGDASATATIATDIPGATTKTVNLFVTGIPAGVTPNPSSVDFGQVEAMTTTIGQPIHLSNCSTGAITFTNAHIEGADAADFAIVAQPESGSISPSASASWLVVFQGHTVGPKQASFVVEYDGGTAMVPLAGEAVGNNAPVLDPGGVGEKSYYTCSSSGSSAAWPMFALGLLLWRRRRTRC